MPICCVKDIRSTNAYAGNTRALRGETITGLCLTVVGGMCLKQTSKAKQGIHGVSQDEN